MGRKRPPGFIKRGNIWHIDKHVCGRRIQQSTGATLLEDAERYVAKLMETERLHHVYGVRKPRNFEEAAARFVIEFSHKRSLSDDVSRLKGLMPEIGPIELDRLHMGTLQPWIEQRRIQEASAGTINHGLKLVRRILNLAATECVDEAGLTWLHTAPKIRLLPDTNKRKPYPLNWDEQERLFRELPPHLSAMALFGVNTGCRDSEICELRWEWEVSVPELGTSVFIVPASYVKNEAERLVVLNKTALTVINSRRKTSLTHVFTYNGLPIKRMNNSAWRRARNRAELSQVRVHDLKHTYGRRLRAAGVSYEDRQDLLGHKSSRMTTHYSAAELDRLIEASNSVVKQGKKRPQLVVLRGFSGEIPAKSPQSIGLGGRENA